MRRIRLILIQSLSLLSLAPSCASDSELEVTAARLSQLHELRAEPKFGPDQASMYPGAPTEAIRSRCGTAIDDLLDALVQELASNPTQAYVLDQLKGTLSGLTNEDSEEQDRALLYLEQIMDILGIESSDGLLNTWRYGFDPS